MSMLGTLARLGLTALNTYPGAPFSGLLWVQFVGCVIMGFCQTESVFFPRPKHNATFLLAITTGFCGSLTTFSSWMLQMFTGMANLDPFERRGRGYSFLSVVSDFMVTMCIAMSSLIWGKQIGKTTGQWRIGKVAFAWPIPAHTHIVVRVLLLLLSICFFVGAAFYTAYTTNVTHRGIGFSLIFSPFAALTRLYLARFLNSPQYFIPYGTLCANVFATLLLSIMYMIPQITHCTPVSRSVMYGIQNGFCAVLSTLSTFSNELHTMPIKRAYIYCIISVAISFSICVIVDGATAWGHGYTEKY